MSIFTTSHCPTHRRTTMRSASLGQALCLLVALQSTIYLGARTGAEAGANCVSSEDDLTAALDAATREDVIKICDGDYSGIRRTRSV